MDSKKPQPKNILLADDDADDCALFEDALREICLLSRLTTANDGVELMEMLSEGDAPRPDVIFLDLNMPRKNGFECLDEIKQQNALKDIPVVIFSTTAQAEAVSNVYDKGANYFICKPNTFQLLKTAIEHVLWVSLEDDAAQPSKENFVLQF